MSKSRRPGEGEADNKEKIFVPPEMIRDIRTDHAGEAGAVSLYRTLISIDFSPEVTDFAARHLAAELRHLEGFAAPLTQNQRSLLLFAWRLTAGLTARAAAFFGRKTVYATIAAIEDGVVRHFQAQIDRLSAVPEGAGLRNLLIDFQADEKLHRDEAAALRGPQGFFLGIWCLAIAAGSAFAVAVTRGFKPRRASQAQTFQLG